MRTEKDGTITYFPLDYPGSEVSVAWYYEVPVNQGNIMAMVFRDGPDKPWKAVIRTRAYVDDKSDDSSKDARSGYMVIARDFENPEDARVRLVDSCDHFFRIAMDAEKGGRLSRLSGHETLQAFMDEWAQQPWAHARIEKRPPPDPN